MIVRNITYKTKKITARLILSAVMIMISYILIAPVTAKAEGENIVYDNPDTGYGLCFDDEAGLISEDQKQSLIDEMKPVTDYANVGFATVSDNQYGNTSACAEAFLEDNFSRGSNSTIFMIDMDERQLYIYSEGAAYNVITEDYANSITDNVYTYASDDADYYECARHVFIQISAVMSGAKISQPMRYISAALIAIIAALIINYFIVKIYSRAGSASESDFMSGVVTHCNISNVQETFVNKTKVYSPQESSSSGGGGGGFSGGGGGGGSCGGGGGHSF